MKQMDFFFPGFVFFFLIETEWEKKNFGNKTLAILLQQGRVKLLLWYP